MTSITAASDVKDDLLLRIRCLLDKSKSELQKVWREEEYSDFEPVTKADLLAALLYRSCRSTSDLDSAQSQLYSSRSPLATVTTTPAPTKSFKEVVRSSARLPSPSPDCDNFENHKPPTPASDHTFPPRDVRQHSTQLQQISNTLKKHEDRIEELSRLSKSKNLVMYGVPEETDGSLTSLMGPEGDATVDSFHRLGRPSAKCSKPRPIRVCFKTLQSKHEFFGITKDIKKHGIRLDDDLTRLQQQEREQLSADFNTLKSKGHKPFFRGSSLKFRHADKTHTCKRNGASRAPDA